MSDNFHVWFPMKAAPTDRPIVVFNNVTGEYETQFKDGEWPLHNWDGVEGTWYPQPERWREVSRETRIDPPKEQS